MQKPRLADDSNELTTKFKSGTDAVRSLVGAGTQLLYYIVDTTTTGMGKYELPIAILKTYSTNIERTAPDFEAGEVPVNYDY